MGRRTYNAAMTEMADPPSSRPPQQESPKRPGGRSLLGALATVSGMTLISRILGFVRDAVIARMFGAGVATDAFFVAFRLPNLLRRLSAEGAFSQAFVPILAEYRSLSSTVGSEAWNSRDLKSRPH